MGMNIQITLTEGHEARDVQDAVGSKVMKLDTIQSEELNQERVDGRGKPPLQMGAKQNAFTFPGVRNHLGTRDPPWAAGPWRDEADRRHGVEIPTHQLRARPLCAIRLRKKGRGRERHGSEGPCAGSIEAEAVSSQPFGPLYKGGREEARVPRR